MAFLVLDMLKKRYIGLIKSHEDFFLKYKTKTVKIEQNKLPVFLLFFFFHSESFVQECTVRSLQCMR